MTAFLGARAAKDFLASQITQQAQRDKVPLSEVERKMLYFTESYESLPDMPEVAERFDAEYDQDEYEAKISKLITNAIDRLKKESPEDWKTWNDAVKYLRKEDHYILVMIPGGLTLGSGAGVGLATGWRDRLKLLATGLAVASVLVMFLFEFLGLTRSGKLEWFPGISNDTRGKVLFGGMALAAIYVMYDYLFPRTWQGKRLKRK